MFWWLIPVPVHPLVKKKKKDPEGFELWILCSLLYFLVSSTWLVIVGHVILMRIVGWSFEF